MVVLDRQLLEQHCGGQEQLNKATKLDLKRKSITEIAPGTFVNLPNVIELRLEENELLRIAENIFDGLTGLQELWLHQNKISTIGPKAFASLPRLNKLALHTNQLESIDLDTFDGLDNLEELFLGKNKISKIAPTAFEKLTQLIRLVIFSNELTCVAQDTFNGLAVLEQLDLGTNKISEIAPKAFSSLSRLKTLYLNPNQLETIVEGTFDGLDSLENLYLNNNKIADISPAFTDSLKSIKVLKLDENPIAATVSSFYDGSSAVWKAPKVFVSNWEKFIKQFQPSKGESIIRTKFQPKISHKTGDTIYPFAHLYICPTCNKTMKEPVVLPCGDSLCKHHQEGFTSIDCQECEQTFDIPKTGFPPNKHIQKMLMNNIENLDLGEEFKRASKESDNFQDIVTNLKTLRKESSFRVHETVSELRARIDLRREELKAKIDKEAIEIIHQLDEYEKECQAKAEELLSPLDSQLATWEEDLKTWKAQLANFKRDEEKWKAIGLESKAKFEEGKALLDTICRETFSDGLSVFLDNTEAIGSNDLIRDHTFTFLVDNLRDQLKAKGNLQWKSSPIEVLGIEWWIKVTTNYSGNVHKVDISSVAVLPSLKNKVVVDLEIEIVSGPESKQVALKSKPCGSNDFSTSTEFNFPSIFEIKDPIESDQNFAHPDFDSFKIIATIKKIEWIPKA